VVPTLASTDAPCSSLVVIYTPEGKFKRYLMIPRNPTLVLVDSGIIAAAPVRFLISGIGDALATWFEAEDCRIKGAGNMTTRPGPMTAFELARFCYSTLMRYGRLAKLACEQHQVTPALEHVIEANTLLSGLGFARRAGGRHAIHNGLTVLPATHKYWHGEKVAFGTLAMLMLTDRAPELIEEVYQFCEDIGLPTTLADIGLALAMMNCWPLPGRLVRRKRYITSRLPSPRRRCWRHCEPLMPLVRRGKSGWRCGLWR
jgi:glycerol dehydrogenase